MVVLARGLKRAGIRLDAQIRVGGDAGGKAARKDAVVAGGEEHFAGLDFFLESHVVDFAVRSALPFQSATHAGLLSHDAGGEILGLQDHAQFRV